MVEHAAVKRGVVGSRALLGELESKRRTERPGGSQNRRLLGQAVKTSPFHGGNTGSIPVGVIFDIDVSESFC